MRAALRAARTLAEQDQWGPEGRFRQAASFSVDDTVQTFVELAGGGKEAFRQMLDRGLYSAYTWRVRHFREGEAHGLHVFLFDNTFHGVYATNYLMI